MTAMQIVPAGPADVRLTFGSAAPPAGFAKASFDPLKFPWDLEDESIAELQSIQWLQRIPAREIEPNDLLRDTPKSRGEWLGRDLLMAFFDECHRVLAPGAKMVCIVPNARHSRAFNDPTHRRFFVAETFLHLSASWRGTASVGGVRCNFDVNADPLVDSGSTLSLLHPEAAQRRIAESWNVVNDWQVRLTKL